MQLLNKVKSLPRTPGVYLMKDVKNEVIYVGKAKNLLNRVRSYFQSNSDERLYCQFMVKRITDVDYIVTDTEKEALILENNLIKQFKPRFNINLRDDKTFVSIKIELNKKFPILKIVRRIDKDGSLYFGPYSSTKAVRETLRYINEIFAVRKCSDNVFKNRKRPCLYYQLGKCIAPCCNMVNEEVYRELIDQIILVLKGKNDELIKRLKEQMAEASEAMRYEDAARVRDRITAIEKTIEGQKIHSMKFVDRDVFGYIASGKQIFVQAMFIRSGNLTDVSTYSFSIKYNNAEDAFCSFLNQFYGNNNFIPKEIIIPVDTEDKDVLEELLTEMKGQKVELIIPKRGEKLKLLQMAQKNAENCLKTGHDQGENDSNKILGMLQKTFELKRLPGSIECFDVSNISGEYAVGAMVVFKDGAPYKAGYRRFKIKDVALTGDFAMMREILTRRYSRGIKENSLPDLTLIDGGKGHLAVASQVFDELNIDSVDLLSIAKGKKQKNTIDHVFAPGKSKTIDLQSESQELLFIQRIRDEAHRFAITYHRKIRQKDQIPIISQN